MSGHGVTAPARLESPAAGIAGAAPVAKLLGALLIALALVPSLDPVSSAVALGLELALLPLLRIPPGRLLRRIAPLLVAAPLAGVTIALYGRTSGEVYARFLLAVISDGSLALAGTTVLRVLAIALPALVLALTIDTTELADGLAQTLRLPARFVLGALAGLRLVGLTMEDRRTIARARRARGVGDRGIVGRVLGTGFTLLVVALRRGTTLATAMEARGFGADVPRTWARPARFGVREWLVVAGCAAIGALALTAAIVTGFWGWGVR
ncbi:MAG: energy-coupling factor transporter transmembrane protein EcfT [Actinomycetales bacterium]|nr:energy-coupling factor transporter transmembrane protein EcfT [Actinomycetales bacterium]